MLPKGKGGKEPDKSKKDEPKRRNSLTDSASTTSNSSLGDSDDTSSSAYSVEINSFGGLSRGTMTSSRDRMNDNDLNEQEEQQVASSSAGHLCTTDADPDPDPMHPKKKKNKKKKKNVSNNDDNNDNNDRPPPKDAGVGRDALPRDHNVMADFLRNLNISPQFLQRDAAARSVRQLCDISTLAAKREGGEGSRLCVGSTGLGIAGSGYIDHDPPIVVLDTFVPRNGTFSSRVGNDCINWREEFLEVTYRTEMNHVSPSLCIEYEALEDMALRMEDIAMKSTSNKWIQDLLLSVIRGELSKAWPLLCVVVKLLQQFCDGPLSKAKALSVVIQKIVDLLVDKNERSNVVMMLVSQMRLRNECACFEGKHEKCMFTDLVLTALPPRVCARILAMETNKVQYRVVHFAALTGEPCQMDIVLKHGANPNRADHTSRAPIHYAIMRNHLTLLRQLMWNGADLNLMNSARQSPPSEDAKYNTDAQEFHKFLKARIWSLHLVLSSWLRVTVGDRMKIHKFVSELHILRIAKDEDAVLDHYIELAQAKGKKQPTDIVQFAKRSLTIPLDRESLAKIATGAYQLVLCLVPFSFSRLDAIMPSECPHVVRRRLHNNGGPAQLLKETPYMFSSSNNCHQHRFPLSSVFPSMNNGFLYAFRMPTSFIDFANANHGTSANAPSVCFTFDLTTMGKDELSNINFLVQAFAVQTVKEKCD